MAIFKFVFGGPNSGGDFWSSGFHGSVVGMTTLSAFSFFDGALDYIFGEFSLPHWASNTKQNFAALYRLDNITGKATEVVRGATIRTGTSAGAQPAPRDCIVVGLRTNVPGPAGRGRMFLPAPSVDKLDANGLLELATRTDIADGVREGLNYLNTSGITTGLWKKPSLDVVPFHGVTVGVVQGTQRRRTNKIVPAYYAAPAF